MNYTKISRELIESLSFRVFTKNDYYGFAGVNSPVPLIAENNDEGILMIIDGGYAELYAYDGCANFDLVDSVDNINDLPRKSNFQIETEAEIESMEKSLKVLKDRLAKLG